jgi:hypothetical protein
MMSNAENESEPKKDSAREFDEKYLGIRFDKDEDRGADPLGDTTDDPVRERTDKSNSEETEDVGYCRPPKKHQFKPGQSGNKKGRPKGAKNESTILREILLQRKVPMRDGGRMRKVQVLEGMLLRFAEDSLKGNTKSAAFLLNRFGQYVSGEIQRDGLNPDDREILDSYLLKFKKQDDVP